jgi:hypothetical protein
VTTTFSTHLIAELASCRACRCLVRYPADQQSHDRQARQIRLRGVPNHSNSTRRLGDCRADQEPTFWNLSASEFEIATEAFDGTGGQFFERASSLRAGPHQCGGGTT